MSHHYFVNKFLQEISIIIILISYLNFHGSKSTRFAIIYYQFIIKKVCDGLNEIYQHLVYKSYKAWFNTCKKHLLTVTSCRCFDLAIYTDFFTLINNTAFLYDKLLRKFSVFSPLGHFSKVTSTYYTILSFILLLKIYHLNSKLSLRLGWPCL